MKKFKCPFIFIFGLCLILVSGTALASRNTETRWPFETTDSWKDIYGTISGIKLEPGDSVGVFDKNGYCYGAGLFDGARYCLRVFGMDTGAQVSGDYEIPGFNPGDKVIFKVYNGNEEYALELPSGAPYIYGSDGAYPMGLPERVDLVYNPGEPGEPPEPWEPPEPLESPEPEEPGEPGGPVWGPIFLPETPGPEPEDALPPPQTVLPIAEKQEPGEPERVMPEEEIKDETLLGYEPPEPVIREKPKEKEDPFTTALAPRLKTGEIKKKPPKPEPEIATKKGMPLFLKILLWLLLLIIVLIIANRLLEKLNEDKDKPDGGKNG